MKGGVYRMLTFHRAQAINNMSCRKSITCDTKNKYRAGRKLIPCRHDMNFFFVLKTVPYNYAGIQCKTSAIQ